MLCLVCNVRTNGKMQVTHERIVTHVVIDGDLGECPNGEPAHPRIWRGALAVFAVRVQIPHGVNRSRIAGNQIPFAVQLPAKCLNVQELVAMPISSPPVVFVFVVVVSSKEVVTHSHFFSKSFVVSLIDVVNQMIQFERIRGSKECMDVLKIESSSNGTLAERFSPLFQCGVVYTEHIGVEIRQEISTGVLFISFDRNPERHAKEAMSHELSNVPAHADVQIHETNEPSPAQLGRQGQA